MPLWHPDPDEILLARVPATFATGAAMRVRGRRWFRDTGRNDIQSELDGWPKGPDYTARSTSSAVGLGAVRGAALAVGVAFSAVLSSAGGNLSGPSSSSGSRSSYDPADEVDDFPVLWAAPGTVARTLPWQLDPARRNQKQYRTHLIVTDRRLLVVDTPFHEWDTTIVDDEVLWEIPRSTVQSIERRDFKDGDDVKVVFTDGSWCRLHTRRREPLLRYLLDRLDFVPQVSLTPGQQKAVETFVSGQDPESAPPVITRSKCGCYHVDVLATSTTSSFSGVTGESTVMDEDGVEVGFEQLHWEDFSAETLRELRFHRPPSGLPSSN
jgi:hypothetical protein